MIFIATLLKLDDLKEQTDAFKLEKDDAEGSFTEVS